MACGLLMIVGVSVPVAGQAAPDAGGYVALKSGRYAAGVEVTLTPNTVEIGFDHGTVSVPRAFVDFCWPVQTKDCEFPTFSAPDRKRLESGQVPLRGQWVSRRDLEAKASAARVAGDQSLQKSADRFAWKNRRTRKSGNFEFRYTVPEARLRAIEEFVEAFVSFVAKDLRLGRRNLGSLRMNVFHDEALFREVVGGKHWSVSDDLHDGHDLELNTFDGPLGDLTVEQRLKESLVDFALFRHDPKFRYPDWIRASLRNAYATQLWDPKSKQFTSGGAHTDLAVTVVRDLDAGRPQRIDDFFGTESDTSTSFGSLFISRVQEPWMCLLIEHLATSRPYAERFRRLVGDMPKSLSKFPHKDVGEFRMLTGAGLREAFEARLGKNCATIERGWHEALATLPRELGPQELEWAGSLALARGNSQAAEHFLNQAVARGNEQLSCFMALAQALVKNGNGRDAASALDKALARDPLNGTYYYWQALSRPRQGEGRLDEEGIRLLKLALEVQAADEDFRAAVEFDMARLF